MTDFILIFCNSDVWFPNNINVCWYLIWLNDLFQQYIPERNYKYIILLSLWYNTGLKDGWISLTFRQIYPSLNEGKNAKSYKRVWKPLWEIWFCKTVCLNVAFCVRQFMTYWLIIKHNNWSRLHRTSIRKKYTLKIR